MAPVSEIDQAVGTAQTTEPYSAPPRPLYGAVLMTTAALIFAIMNGLVKYAADIGMPPLQIAFLRSFFGMIAMMPFLVGPVLKHGIGFMRPVRPGLMAVRGLTSAVGVMLWITAVTMMPLVEVTAISFTAPLIATAGSALILREVVRMRRWSAILIGFVGVLIILRPGVIPFEIGMIYAVLGTFGMAMAVIIIKLLTRTEPASRIVFWTNVGLTIGTFIPALLVWTPLTWEMVAVGFAIGVAGGVSHMFLTRAFAVADATVVMPFDYCRLPFVALIGYVIFGQVSDWVTWLGAAIIAGSAFYVAQREHSLGKAG